MSSPGQPLSSKGRLDICGAPEGFDGLLLGRLAGAGDADLIHVSVDDARMARINEALGFFHPEIETLTLPAWDCLPYDRVSPNNAIVARRIDTLVRLARTRHEAIRGRILLTTVNALLQRMAPPQSYDNACFAIQAGGSIDRDALMAFLNRNGYGRSETAMEPGEYAVRGGIIDVFAPGCEDPLRLDLFGDELERIRTYDPLSQTSVGSLESFEFKPVSEVLLDEQSILRFRGNYRDLFGAGSGDDPLYESVSAGRRHMGMEHWLPLFHDRLETLFAYMPTAAVTLDHQALEVRDMRLEQIADFFEARTSFKGAAFGGETVYNPLPPTRLYLDGAEWDRLFATRPWGAFSPFAPAPSAANAWDAGARPAPNFFSERHQKGAMAFDAVGAFLKHQQGSGRPAVIAAYSPGSRDRLLALLRDHGIGNLSPAADWHQVRAMGKSAIAVVVLGIEHGFTAPDLAVIAEQDILGERLARRVPRRRDSERFLAEVSNLAEGDLVVHLDHGVGRYEGLEALEILGAPHDCLRLVYDGGDKLFVPVENIDILSRYGEDRHTVGLDRLGGAAWQARKARLTSRIKVMAEDLLRIAAARTLTRTHAMAPPQGAYEEFCAGFPFVETDDQMTAIDDTLADLASDRPMDRLICGDVGFGKTEVALRAAFTAALAGTQVAVVVPTTLLSHQHYQTFRDRFAAFPVVVEQLSRFTPPAKVAAVKDGLGAGTVNIVIGTHALLSKGVKFDNLGLLVVDEEQHFGVAHKEKLKSLKANVHVLTMTATPIPRTLQLALTGVKEMSIIATPPVDRLAVRTFILPFDPVVVREAILRERFRGGQSFYVAPRIRDLRVIEEQLKRLVPEVKLITVHGRMAARDLEAAMTSFHEGSFDVLLSTNIIESGLDIPNVNTLIIHRSDMFGLAQLYQLRGRVGRSKRRAYAYLTLPTGRTLSKTATRRLEVMQTLDNLGAGFSLASHDLDIRGAGNLLGDEQSGHIREVGIELYQHMLEEAVAGLRGGEGEGVESWTPQINISMPVLIPESYVADLGIRLGLYRRIANLVDSAEIEAFAAEIIDRFGPLPDAVENLFKIMAIKRLCRESGVAKVEAGPKGAVLSFHNDHFANPAGLVGFIQERPGTVKLRPDHSLVYMDDWYDQAARVAGIEGVLKDLGDIASASPESAPDQKSVTTVT